VYTFKIADTQYTAALPAQLDTTENNGYESVVCEGLLYLLHTRISSMPYPAIILIPDLTNGFSIKMRSLSNGEDGGH
jgi:hypothetical protein